MFKNKKLIINLVYYINIIMFLVYLLFPIFFPTDMNGQILNWDLGVSRMFTYWSLVLGVTLSIICIRYNPKEWVVPVLILSIYLLNYVSWII